jgi:hypothetical protein
MQQSEIEPEVKSLLEEEAVDRALADDEELEQPEKSEAEPIVQPGMTEEIEGLDEEISPIERWQASFIAHEAATADRRLSPAIEEHPDGHKSTKTLKRQERELERLRKARRSQEERSKVDLYVQPKIKKLPRPISADGAESTNPCVVPASQTVYVKLLMFGELKCMIGVPEKITREDLRKRASQELGGRLAIQPEMIPVKLGLRWFATPHTCQR